MFGGTAISTSTSSSSRTPSVSVEMLASCQGMRAAVVPLVVIAAVRDPAMKHGMAVHEIPERPGRKTAADSNGVRPASIW